MRSVRAVHLLAVEDLQLGQLICSSTDLPITAASGDLLLLLLPLLLLLLLTTAVTFAPGIDHCGDWLVVTLKWELEKLQMSDRLEFGAEGSVGGFLKKEGEKVRLVKKVKHQHDVTSKPTTNLR